MLRLNYSSVREITYKSDKTNVISMYAVFDNVTKSGKVKRKHAERFVIENDLLILNDKKYPMPQAVSVYAEPEELIAYFKRVFESQQMEMFLEPPVVTETVIRVSYQGLQWECPKLTWRAMNKGGTVCYFNHRPKIDKTGFWVPAPNDSPKFGKCLCIDADFKRSLQRKPEQG